MEDIKSAVIEFPHPDMLIEPYRVSEAANGGKCEYSQDTAAWD